jgi:hypothetical protein
MGNHSSTTICSDHADCCNNFHFDRDINQTYACTHHYCYPNGIQPDTNNCSKLIKGNDSINIVKDAPNNYGYNLTKELIQINRESKVYSALKYENSDYPFMLGNTTASISIAFMLIIMMIYILMFVYQPIL